MEAPPDREAARRASWAAKDAKQMLESVDEEIAEAERALAELRARRTRHAADVAEATKTSDELAAAEAAKDARIAALIDAAHAGLGHA